MAARLQIFKTLIIIPQRHLLDTIIKTIIETFRKRVDFEKFGKRKQKYGFCVINCGKFDQVENDYLNAFRNATKPNRS